MHIRRTRREMFSVCPNKLLISDTHCPSHHMDAFDFLTALHKKYDFQHKIHVGDEADWHSTSYHDRHPNKPNAEEELRRTREALQELYQRFPLMDIIESNHGSLNFRKAVTHGLPIAIVKSYRDAYFAEHDKDGNIVKSTAGIGWRWYPELVIDIGLGRKLLIVHGDGTSPDAKKNCQLAGMCFASGHHHSVFDLRWHQTRYLQHFGMIIGCLVQIKDEAFDYQRKRVNTQPILGCGGIIDGMPRLFKMGLDKRGRWDKSLP